MTFAFVRHGQTDWNFAQRMQGSSDIPLNATGRKQALEAARSLSSGINGRPWDIIVSSPLIRARETASLIAVGIGRDLGPAYPALTERDYGDAEGATQEEISARWPQGTIPGLEPIESVIARGTHALERLARLYDGDNVLIVCHGTLIRHTLSALTGKDTGEIINGSIATLSSVEGGWSVHTVNDRPFLPKTEATDKAERTNLAAGMS
ncbi:histidine phosphatase family protein [Pseudarthrobacter sp. S9]|uniref:histidine phosphatase family protein n=1 Tax=Pseudarthrobacter sp. S9 TaxID=3418421 RepID=UPI003D062147